MIYTDNAGSLLSVATDGCGRAQREVLRVEFESKGFNVMMLDTAMKLLAQGFTTRSPLARHSASQTGGAPVYYGCIERDRGV